MAALPARPHDDQVAEAFERVQAFAEILRPEDVDEPILAPTVAHAVHEWLLEIHHTKALEAAKVKPRRLALLYGPPGTGKTTLAHHIAARLGLPLVAVASERLVEPYMGSTGRNLATFFDAMQRLDGKCVLLFDEFDALSQKRSAETTSAGKEQNAILTTLLQRIEGYRGIGLAATNTKNTLDPAIWRRFGLQISVDLPGEHERFAILRKYALPFDLDDAAIDVLVSVTRGCSPSLLEQLMDGMKRTLVLAPLLHFDVSQPAPVFNHVIASIAPPPEMASVPLWAAPATSLERIAGIAWPPVAAP